MRVKQEGGVSALLKFYLEVCYGKKNNPAVCKMSV